VNLLEFDGWECFKSIAKCVKMLNQLVHQVKLHLYRTTPKFKYGVEIPRDCNHAMELDKQIGNTKWAASTKLEMDQLYEYKTFEDKGYTVTAPTGFKKIWTHLIFDCKHDGCNNARMVADRHLTNIPLDSVYSGVVSLCGPHTLLFIAELTGLEAWATDVGNANFEVNTKEKVYNVAVSKFGNLEGHILVISKALYGLCTSGLLLIVSVI
jgi:hypothetical protein